MQLFPPTLILRHRKENLKKCSVQPLVGRRDFSFYSYPHCILPDLNGYVMLALDAPLLTQADSDCGLFILDSTWRYAATMRRFVEAQAKIPLRSLPKHFRTAYPRRQEDCSEPERGLASIEAIYIAYTLLGRDTTGLLDHYYWGEQFLRKNTEYRKMDNG